MRWLSSLMLAGLMLVTATSSASEPEDVRAKLRQALAQSIPGLSIKGVRESAVPGLYEVITEGRETIYASADGEHFVLGELYRMDGDGVVNLTEQRRSEKRARILSEVDPQKMISFVPEGPTKATVNVFTDIDCPYCRKLHREVPTLTSQGVRVNYLAFPRSGPGTPSFRKYVSVWCAEDSEEAMNRAKSGQSVPSAECENPVGDQFSLGGKVGVTGTPAIVLEDGRMIRGYLPAQRLVQALGIN